MKKIRIVTVGGCTGYDILVTGNEWRKNFSIGDRYTGSVSRSFFKPGKIAARIQEEMLHLIPTFPSSVREKIKRQIDVIVKTNNIESIVRQQTPNTVVLVDAGYELLDFYEKDDEAFDILPEWDEISSYFPDWFRKEIAQNICKFDTKGTSTAFQRLNCYREFYRLTTEQKCLCVYIDNPATERVYVKELNSVGVNISLFCSKVPFLTATSDGKTLTLNFEYAIKSIDMLYTMLRTRTQDYYAGDDKKAAWFYIDKEMCFADPEHHWGYHPAHLHYTCRSVLMQQLHSTIISLYEKNISSIPLIR